MDLTRKFAIAVVMIIPGFVFGGLAWACYHTWWAVLGVEVIVVLLYYHIITGMFSEAKKA